MKKQVQLFTLLFIIIVMASCTSQTSSNLEYYVCQTEEGADWGFVNNKGEVFLDNMFEQEPTVVRDGVFSVPEKDCFISLYSFDKKKPSVLLEELTSVGYSSQGILPICKRNCNIEVIDTKGKTQFELSEINGKPIAECFSSFMFGYLVVITGDRHYGLIDSKGEIVLKPIFDYIFPFDREHILTVKDNKYKVYNQKGEENKLWKSNEIENIEPASILGISETDVREIKYLVIKNCQTRCSYYIYDWNHDLKYKWTPQAEEINMMDVQDGFFIYGIDGHYGVMSFQGEKIVRDKYAFIQHVPGVGFIAYRNSDREIEILNMKGERVNEFDNYDEIRLLEGNVIIAKDDHDIYFFDKTFSPISKSPIYRVRANNTFSSNVISDAYSKEEERRMTANRSQESSDAIDTECMRTINNFFNSNIRGAITEYESWKSYLSKFLSSRLVNFMCTVDLSTLDEDMIGALNVVAGDYGEGCPEEIKPFRAVKNAYRAEWECVYEGCDGPIVHYFVMKEEDGTWKIDNFIIKTSENPNTTNKLAINY